MGCCGLKKNSLAGENSFSELDDQESIKKKYLLDTKVLGSGSYAKVYRAREIKTGKVVAVKVIDKAHSRRELLDSEITIMRRFSKHKNIVGLFAVYETDSEVQMVIEFMAGGELFEALDANGPYGEDLAAKHLRDMASALEYLHGNRVAHRDLKPENLLLTGLPPGPSLLKLSDFGLAAILQENELFGTACGTWAYCAPEVLRVKNEKVGAYDWRCDMWSLGVLLFVILAAYHPFDVDGTTPDATMQQLIVKGIWNFHDEAWDEVSNEAKDLICALLTPHVDTRLTASQVLTHVWTASMCKYGSLSLKIDSDLKSYSLRMKQRRLKAGMNAAKAVGRMGILKDLNLVGDLEAKKKEKAKEQWSFVKDAISKKLLWKDGEYPKKAALKLTKNRFLRLQQTPDIADVYRQDRLLRVFQHLDRDQNGWLTEQELYRFVKSAGLCANEAEWRDEYQKLCRACGWNSKIGINFTTFQLALSTKDFSFFSTNATLRSILVQLQGEPERGNSVGKLDSLHQSMESMAVMGSARSEPGRGQRSGTQKGAKPKAGGKTATAKTKSKKTLEGHGEALKSVTEGKKSVSSRKKSVGTSSVPTTRTGKKSIGTSSTLPYRAADSDRWSDKRGATSIPVVDRGALLANREDASPANSEAKTSKGKLPVLPKAPQQQKQEPAFFPTSAGQNTPPKSSPR